MKDWPVLVILDHWYQFCISAKLVESGWSAFYKRALIDGFGRLGLYTDKICLWEPTIIGWVRVFRIGWWWGCCFDEWWRWYWGVDMMMSPNNDDDGEDLVAAADEEDDGNGDNNFNMCD